MTATIASNNGHVAETLNITVPGRVTVEVAGAKVHAPGLPNADKTGVKYKAKQRAPLPADDARTDQEILLAVAKTIMFEGQLIEPSSNFRDDQGETMVGLTSQKLDREGKVVRASEPCINFWTVTNLGNGPGIAYQVLVRVIASKNSKGRFITVIIDATKRPQNEFKPVGEVEGTFQV